MLKIGIIGAGIAGLRAARHFQQLGIDYVIFEGSNRIGGRIFPFEYSNGYSSGYLQHGAEYVNGLDNEVYEMAKKLDLFDKFESRTPDLWMLSQETCITVVNGKPVARATLKIFHDFIRNLNEKLSEEAEEKHSINKTISVEHRIDFHFSTFLNHIPNEDHDLFKKLIRIYKNFFQTEWSSPIGELSLSNLFIWNDGTDLEDSAVLNEYGFQTILEEYTSRIPSENIRLSSRVLNVEILEECSATSHGSGKNLKFRLENGEIHYFDACIVTSSLGFLKAHHSKLFTPELPSCKREAIQNMGFGNNLKVFLEYRQPWWIESTSTIMIVSENENLDFMVFQPSSWAENILVCWIAGSGPARIAKLTDSELKIVLDEHLNTQMSKICHVAKSEKIFRKDWITDEFSLGSYSYLTPGEQDDKDIRTLGEPILKEDRRHRWPVICFAGEHTDPLMYQTTVGAARSGLREAIRIANNFC